MIDPNTLLSMLFKSVVAVFKLIPLEIYILLMLSAGLEAATNRG